MTPPPSARAACTALDAGEVDAVNAFSRSQNVVMTVGAAELEHIAAGRLMQVIDAVNRRLTQPDIVQMNAEVTNGEDEADVAQAFLRQQGLLRPIGSDNG